MRTLSIAEQEDRKRKLLQAIIHQYIKTGKPVGSAFLAEEDKLDLSSATIRNVMAELENEGYLTHPHTSAGREPTDKAYRYYVDTLVELQHLAVMEEQRIRQEYEARIREIEQVLLSTSKTLSVLSHYTGFVVPPKLEETKLRHLQLVPLDDCRVLVVLVSDTGIVKQRVVMFESPCAPDTLSSMSKMLNDYLRGRSFNEVRDSILDHLAAARQRHEDMFDLAHMLASQTFDMIDESSLYLEGAGNILSLPDFQDQEHMSHLIHLLDQRQNLGELLLRELSGPAAEDKWKGVRVKIGSENKLADLKDLSLVSSTYAIGDKKVGILGIIGPKRMEYSRMISLVGHIASTVSGALNKLVGGKS
ncbi:MAG TPA: heat-inducible transcriptional repressor HrcA [Elusimicrobiota bacterium]|nr:heat-inducible transcriptional repressor HrcA [Elusimicrobiota bacterium]